MNLASQSITIDEVNGEIPMANGGGASTASLPNDSRELHNYLNSASAPAGNGTVIAGPASMSAPPIIIPTREAVRRENTPSVGSYSIPVTWLKCGGISHHTIALADVRSWLLYPSKALHRLITKHPKVMSRVSMALIVMGSIVLIPGFSACVNGTILAHPAVKAAGGVAVAVGKWLRSAVAEATTQAQPTSQAAIGDGNGRR